MKKKEHLRGALMPEQEQVINVALPVHAASGTAYVVVHIISLRIQ